MPSGKPRTLRRLLLVLSLIAVELVVIGVAVAPTGEAVLPLEPLEWWWPWV